MQRKDDKLMQYVFDPEKRKECDFELVKSSDETVKLVTKDGVEVMAMTIDRKTLTSEEVVGELTRDQPLEAKLFTHPEVSAFIAGKTESMRKIYGPARSGKYHDSVPCTQ